MQQAQDVHQRGLSAPGRPHDRDHLARLDGEVDATERVDPVLAAQAIQSTRMAVSADGQRVFDEVLKRESEHSWTARSRFYLEIAEAPAVVLSLQGHPIDPQCQPGRKLRLYVSRSSIWVEEVETSPALPPDTDR